MNTHSNRIMLIILLVLQTGIRADLIVMTDGESAKTEIVDTSGCNVVIKRNGNNVTIKKKLIDYVVWKTDTISFKNCVCDEKPKTAVKLEDTPEYKLMVLFDNAPELEQEFKNDSRIAVLKFPLLGSYNAEEFAGIQNSIIDVLMKIGIVETVSPADLLTDLESETPKFDYVFVPRKYHVIISDVTEKNLPVLGMIPGGNDMLMPRVKKKELYTTALFILYDTRRKEVVFSRNLVEKRSVWGDSEYSWEGLLTPDQLKEKWEKNQTDDRLDRNAKNIRKRIIKELEEYLGIEE